MRYSKSISSLTFLWVLAWSVAPSLAQTSRLFQWGFGNNLLSSQLPTCNPLPIVVKSFDITTNATDGTPPYFMISFALGGTPITTLIGSDENNLSWTVTHPVGSKLVVLVVDANGSSGGVAPKTFTVIPGSTTQCVTPPQTTPAFSVTTNITGDLSTCQPWGFSIKGGVPPYTVTLLAPNNPVVTNASIGFGDDHFTFINRASPGEMLLGAISDLTGRWASGVASVNTKGSSDTSCTGLVSSSGDSAIVDQQDGVTSSAKKRKTTIIAVSVSLVLLFLLGAGTGAFFYLRKRLRRQEEEDANMIPQSYISPPEDNEKFEGTILSINNYLGSDGGRAGPGSQLSRAALKAQEAFGGGDLPPPLPPKTHFRLPSSTMTTTTDTQTQAYHSRKASSADTANGIGSPSQLSRGPGAYSRPGFSSFPSTSIRRSATAIEAGMVSNQTLDSDSEYPTMATAPAPQRQDSMESSVSSESSRMARAAGPPGVVRRPTVEAVVEEGGRLGVVIQHQDGGLVSELPPPYADRGRHRPS